MTQRRTLTVYGVSDRGTLHIRRLRHHCAMRHRAYCSCVASSPYAECGQALWGSRWQTSRTFDRPVYRICSRCNKNGTIAIPAQNLTLGLILSNPSSRHEPVLHRTLPKYPLCGVGIQGQILHPKLIESAVEAGIPYCKNCERIAESFKGRIYRQLYLTS